MARFEPGNFIWVPHEVEVCIPARIITAQGKAVTVEKEDGEQFRLEAFQVAGASDLSPEILDTEIDDLVNIQDLNENSLLHILRIRHAIDKIYTSISSILISVNPFKMLPLYTPAILDTYRSGYRGKPPHIFGIAYNAYSSMMQDKKDQSVVISGESGAGKSEATKLILQFITDVSSKAGAATKDDDDDDGESSPLEQQILAANPILEAFGNAKTLRNNNSSRFGKLITVNFDAKGAIVGGRIINYLLEKSRVVFQTQGERNYHIFYQLVAAAKNDSSLASKLNLTELEDYFYTSQSGVTTIDGVSDLKEFDDVTCSMKTLRYTEDEKMDVYKIVAGTLHFGNLVFDQRPDYEEAACITKESEGALQIACDVWEVEKELLAAALVTRTIEARGAVQVINYTKEQAVQARDAMVKKVYADLFQRTVNRINSELANDGVKIMNFIGVLDIFGFESFVVNSFEQLCINYCNEKLQFHFNEHIFKMEQELYEAEGIVIPQSSFVDNQPTLDMLEAKTTGVFSICDEELNMPKATDATYLQKLFSKHGKHPNMIRPMTKDCKDARDCFGVLHYAGPVFYNVSNFLDKNKDQLHVDISSVLADSNMNTLAEMFDTRNEGGLTSSRSSSGRKTEGGAKNDSAGRETMTASAGRETMTASRGKGSPKKAAKITLGGQFKTQLGNLIGMLNSTNPHFVRCMKSNDRKVGNVFEAPRMNDQLRYAGLLEVCRIRKIGYPLRRDYDEFFRRYKCCNLLAPDLPALMETLGERGVLIDGEYAVGKTKVFMRGVQNTALEVAREEALGVVAVKVQAEVRKMVLYKRYKRYKKILEDLKEAMEARDFDLIEEALDACSTLPFNGKHLPILGKAKTLQHRIKEEQRVDGLLADACEKAEMAPLKAALNAAKTMNPPYDAALIPQAESIIERLEAEAACRKKLLEACGERTLSALEDALAEAEELNLEGDEKEKAVNLKAKIEEENAMLAKLMETCDTRDKEDLKAGLEAVKKAIEECLDMNLEDREEVAKARAVVKEIRDEICAKDAAEAERMRKEAEEEERRQAEAAARRKAEQQAEATKELEEAIEEGNADKIKLALTVAVNCGCKGDTIKKASKMVGACGDIASIQQDMEIALEELDFKKSSGISKYDLQPLKAALTAAKKMDHPALEDDYAKAKTSFELYVRMYKVRSDLTSSVAMLNVTKMKAALSAAQDLSMDIPIMQKVIDTLREECGNAAAEAAMRAAEEKAATAASTTFKKFGAASFGKAAPPPPKKMMRRGSVATTGDDEIANAEIQAAADLAGFPGASAPGTRRGSNAMSMGQSGGPNRVPLPFKEASDDAYATEAMMALNASPAAMLEGGNGAESMRGRALSRRVSQGFRTLLGAASISEQIEFDPDEGADLEGDTYYMQPRFELKHCYQLRRPEDFAAASALNTIKGFRKAKEDFLRFQTSVIPKSLMELDTDSNKTAIQIHKNLLGFMGDKRMPYPSVLANSILETGFHNGFVRDEIYAQIMKQLTDNEGTDSQGKGWQMLCMSANAFTPSPEFYDYVQHFILTRVHGEVECDDVVKNYAQYCLTCLQQTIDSDGIGFVPTVEEIQAYKSFFPSL